MLATAAPALIAYDRTVDGAGRVAVVTVAGGRVRVVTSATGNEQPAWSPDGRALLNVDSFGLERSALRVTDATGGRTRHLTTGSGLNAYPAWSPDGRSIVWTRGHDGQLAIWRMAADGSHVVRLTRGGHDAHPAWSPDGSRIAFLDLGDGSLRVVLAAGGPARRLPLPVTTDGSSTPSWAPDSRALAVVGADGSLYRVPADGTRPTQLTPGRPARIAWRPVWAPGGSRIAYTDVARGGVLHVLVPGGRDRIVAPHADGIGAPSWSPDGLRLVFADAARHLEIVTVATGARQLLTRGITADADPAWQP